MYECEAVNGDWSLMWRHIAEVVCGGDETIAAYVLGWMARAVQNPGVPGEVAIVLRGGQGSGKGVFAREFGKLFGPHFMQIARGELLTGRFNGHLEKTVLLFADEAFWGGDRRGAGTLKALLTEPTLAIEAKYRNIKDSRNCVHVLMATNSEWAIPADMDDRRFLVLDVLDRHAQDHEYFRALLDQMRAGGREAMLYDLQHYDLSGFDFRTVPKTKALHEQKSLGLEIHQKWWYAKLRDGRLLPDDSGWTGEAARDLLYDDYVEFCKKAGQGRRSVETEMGMRLSKMLPPKYPKRSARLEPRERWVDDMKEKYDLRVDTSVFPTLAECRAMWDALMEQPEDWPSEAGLLVDQDEF